MPANYDLSIWKGNDFNVDFTFKNDASGFDLTGSELIFRATWKGNGELRQELDITDAEAGEASLTLTYSQTRTLPSNKAVSYEIERRIGGLETTVLYGAVTVEGGVNDDA